jgi:aminopeptidase N
MIQRILLLLVLLSGSSALRAQNTFFSVPHDPERYEDERQADMERLILKLSFKPEQGLVQGEVTHIFKPVRPQVDSLFLDGPGIRVSEAFLNGKKVNFKTMKEGITFYFNPAITWNTLDSLRIKYEANPRKGIYFIGWNDPAGICRKQIWTQGQGTDNRYWIPCYDRLNDKVLTEVFVTFDQKYQVLSNGTRISKKDNKNGTQTWHYRMSHPHATYLMMLGIGDYKIKEMKSASGVPINLYYYPEWEDRVATTYKYSKEMFDFFEKEIGFPYAWESYSQIPVQDFMYGAMENTTATVFGDFFMVDSRSWFDRNYVGVNAHELAHQWFGDLVTARCEPHHWLQESFATHYNMIYEREAFGEDYYQWARRNSTNQVLEAGKKDQYPVASSMGGSTRWYPKGALVLHMLKQVVGRESFNKAILHYLKRNAYGNVDSDDLLNAFNEVTGKSLGWFWDEWVYRGGEPSYELDFYSLDNKHYFTVQQVHQQNQGVGLFTMPIEFKLVYEDGSVDSRIVTIDKVFQEVVFDAAKSPLRYVLFDPGSHIIKTVKFKKPFEMLVAQAKYAENMIDRYDAVLAMSSLPLSQKREALRAIYRQEKFHGIKAECIKQLMNDAASYDLLRDALRSNSEPLTKAIIGFSDVLPDASLLSDYEVLLNDSSYETLAAALEKLCEWNPAGTASYLEKLKSVNGTSGRNVEVKRMEIAAFKMQDAAAIKRLVELSSVSYEFRTRSAAFGALKRLGVFNVEMIRNGFSAIFSSNSRLSGPALEYLKHFYVNSVHREMIQSVIRQGEWTAFEKEILQKHFN